MVPPVQQNQSVSSSNSGDGILPSSSSLLYPSSSYYSADTKMSGDNHTPEKNGYLQDNQNLQGEESTSGQQVVSPPTQTGNSMDSFSTPPNTLEEEGEESSPHPISGKPSMSSFHSANSSTQSTPTPKGHHHSRMNTSDTATATPSSLTSSGGSGYTPTSSANSSLQKKPPKPPRNKSQMSLRINTSLKDPENVSGSTRISFGNESQKTVITRKGYGGTSVSSRDGEGPILDSTKSEGSGSNLGSGGSASFSFSARQWIILVIFGVADLVSAMVLSLQAPFYPPEAERKGATPSEYGLVFGIYELTVLSTSPFFGKYMHKLGAKKVFHAGVLTTACSCIAFGLLDNITDHYWFIGLSFLFRITEALGASAFVTSSFALIALEFPESVATTFASLETFFGLGLIVGPSVGGALFQLGGYILPFAFTGGVLLVVGVSAYFVMPNNNEDGVIGDDEDQQGDNETSESHGIMDILRIPGVSLISIALVMTANSIGFLSATLEPHLRQFELTPLETGLMFIIYGGVYAITAPAFGCICDKFGKNGTPTVVITMVGAVLIFIAFLLIGPAPFIPVKTVLWVIAAGLLILGLGLSATLVSAFISMLNEAKDFGYPDNLMTYGVVSGLWTSAVSAGAFLGPSMGGFLYEHFAFRPSTYYIFGCEIMVITLLTLYVTVFRKRILRDKQNGNSETRPLLEP